jgi:hypothetical protein
MKTIQAYAAKSGTAGMLAAGLLVFMAVFYLSALRPEQARLDELRRQVASVQHGNAPAAAERSRSASETLGEFYGSFPAPANLPDLLGKVFAAADQQRVSLDQGEYRVVKDSAGALAQFHVVLPVRGTYPQVRKFLAEALAGVPTMSLDSIQFERQKVGDSTVEAKIKFIVYMGRPS